MNKVRNYTTISKNGLTIATDYAYLQQCFNEYLNYYDACVKERIEDMIEDDLYKAQQKGIVPKLSDNQLRNISINNNFDKRLGYSPEIDAIVTKSLEKIRKRYLTRNEIGSVLLDFKNIIDAILSGHVDIFPCIPLTKQGQFSKNKNFVVKSSKVTTALVTSEYVSSNRLQLRLVNRLKPDQTAGNPNLYLESSDYNATGDGKTLYLEVDFYDNANPRDEVIFDENNNMHAITCIKKKYLKDDEILVGHKYEDAKGAVYTYLGVRFLPNDTSHKIWYTYCRCTKQALKVIPPCPTCKSIEEIESQLHCNYVANPKKFIREV